MIPVTKPFFPNIEEYQLLLEKIWENGIFTNNGPFVREFEKLIIDYLNVDGFSYVNNGTIALQIAIKALKLSGEIITTPFSYVATTSALVWENCIPVFADIDQSTFNIDPKAIVPLINNRTKAILATHCFGNPCQIDELEAISIKYGIPIIYDAAHCFGTKYKGQSVFSFGTISTTSFHATKIFHTVEGGGLFYNDSAIGETINLMRNFGHNGPEKFSGVGVNGKSSELHAAMGVLIFKSIGDLLNKRKEQFIKYFELLKDSGCTFQKANQFAEINFSYFPIVFDSEIQMLRVKNALEEKGVSPRRYFYPSLSNLDYVNTNHETPVSNSLASKILCLPLYHTLSSDQIEYVSQIVNENL